MNDRRTIGFILLLLTVTVAANILLSLRAPSTNSLRNRPLLNPSFDIRSIVLENPGEPQLAIRKTGGWSIVSPFVSAADGQAVLRLADAFISTPVDDVLSDADLLKLGRTREAFGFADSNRTISFSDGTREISYAFGDLTPSSNGVYVVMNGLDAVFVVPSTILTSISTRADTFRERDVFPYEPDFVVGFDIKEANSPLLALVREGERWKIGDAPVAGAKVQEFLALVADANAVDFLWPTGSIGEKEGVSAAKLSAYGLDAETALSVVLHCMDGADHRILLGQDVDTDRTYALVRNGEAIVTLDSALKSALLQGERAFSDSRLFPVEASTVRTFTIFDGDDSYVFTRGTSGTWNLESPVVAPAAEDAVSAVLDRLVSLTPADIVESGLKVAVTTNLTPCVVSPVAVLGDMRLSELRAKEILTIDPSRIRRIVSTFDAKSSRLPTAVVYSRERRVWNVETGTDEGSERTADEEGIRRVLTALQPLRAMRIESISASSSDLVRYGLETPYCSIAVDQEKEGAVRRNILIGAKTANGDRYATIGASGTVFVLSKKTVDELTSPLTEE